MSKAVEKLLLFKTNSKMLVSGQLLSTDAGAVAMHMYLMIYGVQLLILYLNIMKNTQI